MKKITKKDVIELLIKKANGFYYTEEQFEYEKNEQQKKSKQADFIEANNDICSSLEDEQGNNVKTEQDSIESNKKINSSKNKNKIISKKVGRGCGESELSGDIMEVSSENNNLFQESNLMLFKKKVSRHYVPPDMVAIKILFEIFDKEVDECEIEGMSDADLLKLKKQLMEDLKDDDI